MFIFYFFRIRSNFFFSKQELSLYNDIDCFVVPSILGYPHYFLNKPFILTLHDMQEVYFPEYFSKFRRFLRWLNNRALSNSAIKILCESRSVKSDIVKYLKINEKKIIVIPSPPPSSFINFKFDNTTSNKIRDKYNIKNKFIFYPAQTWYHKNHLRLIDAFKIVCNKFENIDLVLTGSPKSNHSKVVKKIKENNLTNKIKYLGYINYSDLPYIYKSSQFLIMPSLFESVSIPVYESFALKVPVACSNVVSLPEQVGDAALLFDPLNVEDIVEKMMIYLSDKDLRHKMSLRGYDRVRNFNHDNYCYELVKNFNFLNND